MESSSVFISVFLGYQTKDINEWKSNGLCDKNTKGFEQ